MCLQKTIAMNFYDASKPLYILLSFHALFPYSVKFSKDKHFTIITKSIYLNGVCAFCIVFTLLLFGILHVKFVYVSSENSTMIEGVLAKINYVVEVFTLIIFCVITYICFYLNRYKFVKILNKITTLIESTNGDKEDILKNLRHQIKLVLTFLPIVLIVPTALNFTRQDSFWKMILVMFNYIITQTIQFIVIDYYNILLKIVILLLEYIKRGIVKTTNEKTLMNCFIKIEPAFTLRRLEKNYVEVLAVKRAINYIFQAPLSMSIIQSFHSLVSQSYILYHGMVVESKMTTHDSINCFCWLPYQILKVIALAYTGQSLETQVIYTLK